MLTEPLTAPTTKQWQVIYGGLVGLLFGLHFQIGPLVSSPEFALIIGNIFSYCVSPKGKLFLRLQKTRELAPNIFEFSFLRPVNFSFHPGQYLEWTLPYKPVDSRGNRRYFTIASSPTEKEIKLGIKIIPDSASGFKKALLKLKEGEPLVASQRSGDFILPRDASKKLVFIAGGIGITPFRSMLRFLIDTNDKRPITLFYSAATAEEFVYKDIFDEATQALNLQVVYVLSDPKKLPAGWKGESGFLTSEMIKKYVPDVQERTFYLSGPNAMVESYKKLLTSMRVMKRNIITDYFPGF
jgi:ferredoxin-NADP reductase